MKILEAKNLTIGYKEQVIKTKLNFTISNGDFVCLVGSNGSGKTTLISTILGLIPKISGELKMYDLKQTEIGYMPQVNKILQDFPATVYEIIESGALVNRRNQSEILDIIKKFNLDSLIKTKFSKLSGGQKQKALLARAVVAASKLLILDEPYNNLDQASRSNLYKELKELNQTGMTIIMITHDLDHSSLIGDKTLSLDGDNFFFGSTQDYFDLIHHKGVRHV